MNIIITSLFPGKKNIDNSHETKAVYNLIKNENILVIYPIYIPYSIKGIKNHIKEPFFQINNIKVFKFPIIKMPKKEIYFLMPLKILIKFLETFKGINNIIFHRVNIGIILDKFLKKNDISYKFIVHASDLNLIKKNKLEIDRDVLNFRSHALKKSTEDILGESLDYSTVVYSGINHNEIVENEKAYDKHNDYSKINICTVCTLRKLKNVESVLIELSKWDFKSWTYYIVGNGPQMESLKKLAKELNIADKVIFTGQLNRDDVNKILLITHIFIMISKPETFGLVYLEAMAKGCIVFCSKDNGIDGILENNKNGFTIENSNEVLAHLNKLIQNENFRLQVLKETMLTINKFTEIDASVNYERKILGKSVIY